MNEGDSAGGGHQGPVPAPPAVPDRNTPVQQQQQDTLATTPIGSTQLSPPQTTEPTGVGQLSFQQVFTQQQQHKTKPSAGSTLPKRHQLSTPNRTSLVTPLHVTPSQPSDSAPTQSKRPKIDTGETVSSDTLAFGVASGRSGNSSTSSSLINAQNRVGSGEAGVTPPSPQQHHDASHKQRVRDTVTSLIGLFKERHDAIVLELFHLQRGDVMMEQTDTSSPEYVKFCIANRVDQLVNADQATLNQTIQKQQQLRQQLKQLRDQRNAATVVETDEPTTTKTSPPLTPLSSSSTTTTSATTTTTSGSAASRSTTVTATSTSSSASSAAPIESGAPTTSSTAGAGGRDAGPPQGAEIKIPAIGATPVAVSTKLPDAVVQLTQQGGTPLVPCSTATGTTALRRNGNGISQTPTPAAHSTSTSAKPPLFSTTTNGGGSGTQTGATARANSAVAGDGASTSAGGAQEFSMKAKQEVYVLQRVSELQREGLWTEKRLPKCVEPSRPKAHWDYVLEEMVWLATDFANERKWKKSAAKKCSKMVQKYFQEKANAAQRAEKAEEAYRKRQCAIVAREVRYFWASLERLVGHMHHQDMERKRKKALDDHLADMVTQSEMFSTQLAHNMIKPAAAESSAGPSINSSRISSPKRDSDDDFRPQSGSDDDEETIAKAEEEEAVDRREELAALERESQMELDDILKDLPEGYLENRNVELPTGDDDEDSDDDEDDDKEAKETGDSPRVPSKRKVGEAKKPKSEEEDTDDGDFEATEASEDDENTINQQETEEMDVDHQKELDELEADNDLSVAELRAKYMAPTPDTRESIEAAGRDSDDDSTDMEDDSDDDDESMNEDVTSESEMDENEEEHEGLKSLIEDNDGPTAGDGSAADGSSAANKDDLMNDAAALAESLQPKGNTLSSTNVVTPVPFLLKHTLREYQHIGLDWLVTMYERKLNGILADEMGLGKTIQTIALLAHLACVKCNWGPHLIVVPSSVMLNWEMEFKKWCPGFKILTYYGSQKERKAKRIGWTKPNAFHVCITSYKLVVQDQQSFRRKKWKYLILDEAQNIKNFKSQRWQLLLNFTTERRLLLTGTPLQNNLMELWSLMHFLMPYVFSSHREFKEWFSNPMNGMIEGNKEFNDKLIIRLHKVMRPFLLRRLKKEVEKQMPKKYEHVVMCRLSKRQRYLYDDFMSRAQTKETLQTGGPSGVIGVLMQLRKVCNHPNLFEVRPIISPLQMEGIVLDIPRLVSDMLCYDPFKHIDLYSLNLNLLALEMTLSAYAAHRLRHRQLPRKLIEEMDSWPPPAPPCPRGEFKFQVRFRNPDIYEKISAGCEGAVRVGTSPAMTIVNGKATMFVSSRTAAAINASRAMKRTINVGPLVNSTANRPLTMVSTNTSGPTPAKIAKVMQDGKPFYVVTPRNAANDAAGPSASRLTIEAKSGTKIEPTPTDNVELVNTLAREVKTTNQLAKRGVAIERAPGDDNSSELDPVYGMSEILQQRKEQRRQRLKLMATLYLRQIEGAPIYGSDVRDTACKLMAAPSRLANANMWQSCGFMNCRTAMERRDWWSLNEMLNSYERRFDAFNADHKNYLIYVPPVCAPRVRYYTSNASTRLQNERQLEVAVTQQLSPMLSRLHPIISAMSTQFPDARLIQYDCGKLQTLDRLLRKLKSEQHRVLIFTQMTKMLNVLEAFLNYHGHIYLRLDGTTRVEQRQLLMERFNGDPRIFCFILSTRSGGVGVNLTGADTVIFYDSDWNPTMDAQAQDRCHRIGQTRDVHIYRLISEKTIEVNILKKANQKRLLSELAIEGGNFTTDQLKQTTIKELFNVDDAERPTTSHNASAPAEDPHGADGDGSDKFDLKAYESALAAAEDEQDVQATRTARAEAADDLAIFDEDIPVDESGDNNGASMSDLTKAEQDIQNIIKKLTPVEKYALRFVQETGAASTAKQLRDAEAELEAQKREWEANRLAALQKEEELLRRDSDADDVLTYQRQDAQNQVNSKSRPNSRVAPKSRHKAALATDRRSRRGRGGGVRASQPARADSVSGEGENTPQLRPQTRRRGGCNVAIRGRPFVPGRSGSRRTIRASESTHKVPETAATTPTKPSRKTTRTSMAAAAATHNQNDDDEEEEEVASGANSSNDDDGSVGDSSVEDDEEASEQDEDQSTQEEGDDDEEQESAEELPSTKRRLPVRGRLTVPAKRRRVTTTTSNNAKVAPPSMPIEGQHGAPVPKVLLRRLRNNPKLHEPEGQEDADDDAAEKDKTDEAKVVKVATKRRRRITRGVIRTQRVHRNRRRTAATRTPRHAASEDEDERSQDDREASVENDADGEEQQEEEDEEDEEEVEEDGEQDEEDEEVEQVEEDEQNDELAEIEHVVYDEAEDDSYERHDGDANEDDDDDDDNTSYATAGGDDDFDEAMHSNSTDAWNAHSQLHDTNNTNSTYYNVSEETETDTEHVDGAATGPADGGPHNSRSQASRLARARLQRISRSLTPANANTGLAAKAAGSSNHTDVNSPRTRSRGSVNINLWNLDKSQMLTPGVKPLPPLRGGSQRPRMRSIRGPKDDPLVLTRSNDVEVEIDECEEVDSDDEATVVNGADISGMLSDMTADDTELNTTVNSRPLTPPKANRLNKSRTTALQRASINGSQTPPALRTQSSPSIRTTPTLMQRWLAGNESPVASSGRAKSLRPSPASPLSGEISS